MAQRFPGLRALVVASVLGVVLAGVFFAVRHVPEEPIDLRDTPHLELPLKLGPGARVGLHLEIGGEPFIVPLGDGPLAGIKAFLVPGAGSPSECVGRTGMWEAAPAGDLEGRKST